MPFPFTIKFTRKFKETFQKEDYTYIFKHLSSFLAKKGALDITIKNNVLEFNQEFNYSNLNLIWPVDSGEFAIISTNNELILTYEVCFYQVFFVDMILSFGIGIIFKSIFFGICFFIIFFGSNLLQNAIKHNIRLKKIVAEIDALIQQNDLSNS